MSFNWKPKKEYLLPSVTLTTKIAQAVFINTDCYTFSYCQLPLVHNSSEMAHLSTNKEYRVPFLRYLALTYLMVVAYWWRYLCKARNAHVWHLYNTFVRCRSLPPSHMFSITVRWRTLALRTLVSVPFSTLLFISTAPLLHLSIIR